MIIAPLPFNEAERLEDLASYDIMDTPAEDEFESIVNLASQICNTPISLVTLLDKDRQWFKAKKGIDVENTPRDLAFCAHAILQDGVMVVEDTLQDERFADNPFVTNDNPVRFYAGAPIISPSGYKLGTVCIIDHKPKTLSEQERNALEQLSKIATRLLEIKQKNILIRKKAEEFIALKSLAAQAYMAQTELSKKQMAHQLHENTAQTLASALMMLQVARDKSEHAKPLISEVQKMLSQTLREIKSQAFRLTPLMMVGIDSSEMITEYLKQLSSTYPFEIHIESQSGQSNLEPEVLIAATRIVEQWLNVLSYKNQVSDVRVRLQVNKNLSIEIQDNEPANSLVTRRNEVIRNVLLDELHAIGGQVDISIGKNNRNVLALNAPLQSMYSRAAV